MASTLVKTATFSFLILSIIFNVSAARVLSRDPWLPMAVLQRGPVPSSGRNPCSLIPGLSRGRCTLSDVDDVAASTVPGGSSAAFPGVNAAGFAAVSVANQTQKPDSS